MALLKLSFGAVDILVGASLVTDAHYEVSSCDCGIVWSQSGEFIGVFQIVNLRMRPSLDVPKKKADHPLIPNSKGRTVSIYRARGSNDQFGGLINTRVITNKSFHGMLEIFDGPYTQTFAGGSLVPKDGAELEPGNYYVDGKSKTLAHLFVALLIYM